MSRSAIISSLGSSKDIVIQGRLFPVGWKDKGPAPVRKSSGYGRLLAAGLDLHDRRDAAPIHVRTWMAHGFDRAYGCEGVGLAVDDVVPPFGGVP